MIYVINIVLFAVVIYFTYKNYTLTKKKIIEEVDKEWLRLPIPKYDVPKFEEFDTDHTLLKNVLESIKLEDWTTKIEPDRSYLLENKSYLIELYNPSNTLKIISRLHVYKNKVDLGTFRVIKMIANTRSNTGSISYDCNNKEISTLILARLWSYILEHHEKEFINTMNGYKEVRESIDTELKTLKRDNFLKSLLDN